MADFVLGSMSDVDVVMEATQTSRTAAESRYAITAVKLVRRRVKQQLSPTQRRLEKVITPSVTAGTVEASLTMDGGATVALSLNEASRSVATHTFPVPLLNQSPPSVSIGWSDNYQPTRGAR